jgi:prepilin-type N-terminal cleavage/methylation domain-containing protein
MNPRIWRNRGFSLIELMVALTLGLVLLAGVAQVFVNSKQGYRVQESVGRLQENARYASGYLSQYIRMADLWSGVKPAKITIQGTPSFQSPTTGGCNAAWSVDPTSGIVGYSGSSSYPLSPFPAGCFPSAGTATPSYIPNSDVLAIRYIDPNTYINTATLTTSPAPANVTANGNFYLRTLVGSRADLFDIANAANAVSDIPGDAIPSGTNQGGVLNYQFQNVVFYLLNADNGQGSTPTLYILTLTSAGLTAQPLVDGIEMMKFEYGIDTNGDQQVDQYATAASVTNWSQVISVRVSFIARGDALDNYTDTQSYTMTGAGYVYTPAASVQKYQRRLIVREIQLRNRVRQ